MAQPFFTFRALRKWAGPAWLVANDESELVGYTLDAIKDAFVERLRQGLLARFPQNDPAGNTPADDALAAQGRDRRIVRGLGESSPAYARRLLRWLDDWKSAGNPFALMKQLAAYAGPLPSWRTVDVRGNWYSLAADGTRSVLLNQTNWDWDGTADALARWSRFWVVCYPNGLWSNTGTWGDGTWGDGSAWGTTAPPAAISTMQGIIRDWKPGGTRCVNLILAFDPTSFDPTKPRDGTGLPNGLWGHWSTGGRVRVPGRLSTARYCDGTP